MMSITLIDINIFRTIRKQRCLWYFIDNKIDRGIDASASAVRKYFRLYQICYSLFVDK